MGSNEETKLQAIALEPRSIEPRRMLTEAQVLEIVPVGRTTLYEMVKTQRFPRGTYVSPNRRLWFADEVAAWQKALSEGNPLFNPSRGRGHGRPRQLSVVSDSSNKPDAQTATQRSPSHSTSENRQPRESARTLNRNRREFPDD